MLSYHTPSYLSREIKYMFDSIFKSDPEERPKCKELLTSEWFNAI